MDNRWSTETVESFSDTAKAVASAVKEMKDALHQVSEHWSEHFDTQKLRQTARESYDYVKNHPAQLILAAGLGLGLSYLLFRDGGMLRSGRDDDNNLDLD